MTGKFCLFLALTFLQTLSSPCFMCECGTRSPSCATCLLQLYRQWPCNCLPGFIEADPPSQECRPKNCTKSAFFGCLECPNHMRLQYVDIYRVTVCVCQNNYYSDQGLDGQDQCLCMADNSPTLYYAKQDICYKCPEYCACNATGCITCQTKANRTISLDKNGKSICECIWPLVNNDGLCICYKGCQCQNDTISCGLTSYRHLGPQHTWKCIHPFTEIGGECKCLPPYELTKIPSSQIEFCYCPSKMGQVTTYYYDASSNICRICLAGCICNEKGCISCEPSLHRQSVNFVCRCIHPFTEFQKTCVCVQPYTYSNKSCVCKDSLQPTLYASSFLFSQCYKCPDQCSCNKSGCISCSADSLRLVENYLDESLCTQCKINAIMKDGQCVCKEGTKFQDGECVCNEDGTYLASDGLLCNICPQGCVCQHSKGCISCQEGTQRRIVEEFGVYTCPCQIGLKQEFLECYPCEEPYIFNLTSGKCECIEPYHSISDQFTNNSYCQCKSSISPTLYMFNSVTRACFPCPLGCTCNSSGCFSCDSNTLRFSYKLNDGSTICPCIQSASQRDNECTICAEGSYVVNGKCVECKECKACNMGGCTKCNSNMYLDDNSICKCYDPDMENVEGVCVCAYGKFMAPYRNTCIPCPKNCGDCRYNPKDEQNPICESCRTGDFNRQNSPADNCPCEIGFKELGEIQMYCCSSNCQTCNESGCISCSKFTHRQLVNGSCLCKEGFIENNSMPQCICSLGTTLFEGQCVKCSPNCKQCEFLPREDRFICISCPQEVTRHNITNKDCPCNPNFVEAQPVQSYCVPANCVKYNERTCLQCDSRRNLTENGQCVCPNGFFQNIDKVCINCSMEGCLLCTGFQGCYQCDSNKSYFLTSGVCKLNRNQSSYIYSQSQTGIIIEVELNELEYGVYELAGVQVDFQDITTEIKAIDNFLEIQEAALINRNILYVKIVNPQIRKQNGMLSILIELVNKTTPIQSHSKTKAQNKISSSYSRFTLQTSMYRQVIYSKSQQDVNNKWYYQLEFMMTIIIMLCTLGLYLRGFKHNQTLFFIQTMAFIGYILKDHKFHLATFLYNLRFSYYDFGNILKTIIPKYYLEESKGNFWFFTIDSNIWRVAGSTLTIALIVCCMITILRLVYYAVEYTKLRQSQMLYLMVNRNKKHLYRILEFFYKTCMYPLMFFSLITFKSWNPIVFISLDFHGVSHALCIILFIMYSVVTIYQVWFETIARIYKFENLLQYVSDLLAGLIIAVSIHKKTYLTLIIVFVVRGALYLVIRRMFLRDFQRAQYIKVLSVIGQVVTISLVTTNKTVGVLIAGGITVAIQIFHSCAVVFQTEKEAWVAKGTSTMSIQETNGRLEFPQEV